MRTVQQIAILFVFGLASQAKPQECCVTVTDSEIPHAGCGRSADLKNSSNDRSAVVTIERTTSMKNHPPDTDQHEQNIGPALRVFIGCRSYSTYKGPLADTTVTYKIGKVTWNPAGQ